MRDVKGRIPGTMQMTHDFAKKKKPPARKKPMRKTQVPGWVWLFTGIVTGVFISFLTYLTHIAPESPPKAGGRTAAAGGDKKPDKTTTTKFDFYTLLPEREMIVPNEPDDKDAASREPTVYILQAGSFKHAEEADRLRARLILMGMDAKVDSVTGAGGELWYRVQVGPFADGSHMAKARNTLIAKGIDTLVMKKRKPG